MARQIPPSRERRASGVHGAVDIRFAGDLNFVGDERVVGRVVDGEGFSCGGGDVEAVDEEIGLEIGHFGRFWGVVGWVSLDSFCFDLGWTGLDWIRIHDWIEMVRIGSVGIVSYQGLEREDQSVQLDSASEKGTRGISKLAKS